MTAEWETYRIPFWTGSFSVRWDTFQLCLKQQNQVFKAKERSFPNLSQVVFLPKPDVKEGRVSYPWLSEDWEDFVAPNAVKTLWSSFKNGSENYKLFRNQEKSALIWCFACWLLDV